MILVLCLPCALAIRVLPVNAASVPSVEEVDSLVGRKSDFWPDRFPCPRCSKSMTGILEREADPRALEALALRDLTPQEAFAVFNGVGFPDEQRCSFAAVQELLRAHPIRRLVGRDVAGIERTIVDALELWDGTMLHFGAGTEGAVVYRIVRPTSYTDKVLAEGAGDVR